MPPTVEELDRALADQDVLAVIRLFAGASEAERRVVAPRALAWVRAAIHHAWSMGIAGRPAPEGPPEAFRPGAGDPARVAALACASWGDVRKLGSLGIARCDYAYEVLKDRRPSWLASWAKYVCEQSFNTHWLVVRRLEREGLIQRPEVPAYWLGMAVNIPFHQWLGHVDPIPSRNPITGTVSLTAGRSPQVDRHRVKEILLEDPELLREHVWRMLEEEEAMARIASADTLSSEHVGDGARWAPALVELSREGTLPRERLLEAALQGLGRATQKSARWFASLVETLQPTLDELAAHRDAVGRLVGSSVAAALEAGFNYTTQLLEADRLGADQLIDAVRPTLTAKAKAHATEALRLLELAAERQPAARSAIARAAVDAFEHDGSSVHERAVRLLERCGDAPEATVALRAKLDRVAPSVRPRAEKWLQHQGGATADPPTSATASSLDELEQRVRSVSAQAAEWSGLAAAVAFAREQAQGPLAALALDDDELPRLDAALRSTAITDLDSLVDGLLVALEGRARADDVERLIAGLARCCDERPPDFAARVAPLRKRANDQLTPQSDLHRPAPFAGLRLLDDLAGLALAWTDGRRFDAPSIPPAKRPWSTQAFLSERLRRVAAAVAARRPQVLLSEPTHRGGWIDPRVVPIRWREAQSQTPEIDVFDGLLCLLRLAREGRAEARAAAAAVTGEFGAALRYALGGSEAPGPTAPLWVAAARARAPYADDPAVAARHPGLGPAAGLAARYSARIAKQTRPFARRAESHVRVEWAPEMKVERRADLPTVLLHLQDFRWDSSALSSSWEASVWPSGREAFFASEVNQLATFLESQGSYWQGDWEPLFDPDEALGPMARLLIALALTARHPAAAGLGRDALIAAIDDGRLDGEGLAQPMTLLLPTDVVTHSRQVAAFRDAARISPLHMVVLRDALEAAAHALPASPANRLVPFLELLLEWSVETEAVIARDDARLRLEQVSGGGKAASLARSLLALERKPQNAVRRAAGLRALENRMLRAERYEARLRQR